MFCKIGLIEILEKDCLAIIVKEFRSHLVTRNRRGFENQDNSIYTASQKHESTLRTPYVCTELIFDSRLFMYNKIFLKKFLLKLVAPIFTLLLAPLALKLVNYSRPSEFLKLRKNSKLTSFSSDNTDFTVFKYFSKTHCASKN